MDACDHMMEGVGLEKGLIRYDSESSIQTREPWKLTRRAKAYIALMIAIIGLLVTLIFTRSEIDATILRVRGTTFQRIDENTLSNIFEATITNKTNQSHQISIGVTSENATVEIIGGPFELKEGEQVKRNLLIRMRATDITGPKTEVVLGIFSGERLVTEEEVSFSGPGF